MYNLKLPRWQNTIKNLLGYQKHQVVERWINQYFENHLRKLMRSNIHLFIFQSHDAAGAWESFNGNKNIIVPGLDQMSDLAIIHKVHSIHKGIPSLPLTSFHTDITFDSRLMVTNVSQKKCSFYLQFLNMTLHGSQ